MMKKIFTVLFILVSTISWTQDNPIFDRLQAIHNNGTTFYNIDGYTVTSQTLNYPFTEKGLKKVYRKYSIKKDQIKTKDEQLPYQNYSVVSEDEITDSIVQNTAYYFIENEEQRITIIQFSAINKRDTVFEHSLIESIIENTIPKENYNSAIIDSINFAGRKIKLGSNCNWANVNSVQCPYYGQMNWSVHAELEDAKNTVNQQLEITKSRKNGKVLSEEMVDIIFEGTETTAKKVIYDLTGITSLLASASGGKTLTIYYVAAEVRGNSVSCVMSFWNNDTLTESGLAPLLEEVMQLKSE
jgi:hypothetical protein